MLAYALMALVAAADIQMPAPVAVTVPAKLLAVTSNPELSGIVWSPRRRRYLVVSDDSGVRGEGSNHRPLLLALGDNGALDDAPVPIVGIDKLNDPESICAGPGGTYFVVTSHSPNREGKTPAARRQLLHLEETETGLAARGRLDLTRVEGKGLLAAAELPTDGRLDIEAVTFHDGALLVGFKSPLTSAGEAVIVRIANPLKAIAAGRLRGSDIRPFAKLRLCVDVKGESVCEGISDMTFLPSGDLLVSANSPKGGPKDHGGALWLIPKRPGPAGAVLVRRFPHLKPEGVTLSAKGDGVVVVFDRDQAEPQWLRLPLPIVPETGR